MLSRKTGSTAFGLMFNWPFNGLGDFHDVADEKDLDHLMEKQKKHGFYSEMQCFLV